jgi:16S rRNA (guanine966-N2)-methyltransferase
MTRFVVQATCRASRVLRIIGGRHRGRRCVSRGVEIRPTPDRVRETLFNWLQPRIAGRACSTCSPAAARWARGAVARRGARELRRTGPAGAQAIDALAQRVARGTHSVDCADALGWLRVSPARSKFDIVFVDPPYDADLLAPAPRARDAGALARMRACTSNARARAAAALPRAGRAFARAAGEVGYHLLAT